MNTIINLFIRVLSTNGKQVKTARQQWARTIFECILLILLTLNLFPTSAQSYTTKREVIKLSDGIYSIRHKDGYMDYVQANSLIIIGNQEVMVVDAPYFPSAAREDINEIKKLTSKPVRYLVNTHWHPDHSRANAAYKEEFPSITIISHHETKELIKNFDQQNLVRARERTALLHLQIANKKTTDGKQLTAKELEQMQVNSSKLDSVLHEFKKYEFALPNLMFNSQMNIDLGGMEVKLMHIGIAHTLGDIVVYLPKEKILAAGDIIVHPVPYFFGGGYPYESIEAIEKIKAMNLSAIVPGHGDVLYNKDYLNLLLEFLYYIRDRVESEVHKRGSLSATENDVVKAIDISDYRKIIAGENKGNIEFFDESIDGLIRGFFRHFRK